jgi:hypothetical protein
MAWWLLAGAAAAFELTTGEDGAPLRWSAFPVTYAWSPDDGAAGLDAEALSAAVDAGFDAWAQVDGAAARFAAQPAPGSPRVAPEAPNYVHVLWPWPYDPELLALTSAWADADGQIVAFELQLNGAQRWDVGGAPDAHDVQAAVTHEVGHALGLSHSGDPDAAMFATSLAGEVWRRELHDDDQRGLRALYPATRRGPEAAAAGLGCATRSGRATPLGIALASIATLILHFRSQR